MVIGLTCLRFLLLLSGPDKSKFLLKLNWRESNHHGETRLSGWLCQSDKYIVRDVQLRLRATCNGEGLYCYFWLFFLFKQTSTLVFGRGCHSFLSLLGAHFAYSRKYFSVWSLTCFINRFPEFFILKSL